MIISIRPNALLRKQKNILDLPIEVMPVPKKVYIHLAQHKGRPAIPIVKPGDLVKIGSKIGASDRGISATVHSSISGKVIDIRPHPHPLLNQGLCCIIESDYQDDWEQKFIDTDYQTLNREELLEKIKQAGVVGMTDGYPTDIKLLGSMAKRVEKLLINCYESEPHLSAKYRIMMEYPACIAEGAKIIQKIINASELVFVLPPIYKNAVGILKKEGVKVKIVSDHIPQNSDRLLIKRIKKQSIAKVKSSADIQIMVQDVSTCFVVFQAVKYNKPLIERVVTITGDGIKNPKNLLVRIGTPINDIIEYCGGLTGNLKKIIFGGLITGIAQFSLDTPIVKTTAGIVFQNKISDEETITCVRCGKCIDVCPMNLLPQVFYQYIRHNLSNEVFAYGLNECIECGYCAYICPSAIPLVHYFKFAKMKKKNG